MAAAPAAAAAAATVQVKLTSADGTEFVVADSVAKMSTTIKQMIEEIGADAPIPVPSVKARALAKVIEYAEEHTARPDPPVSEAERYRTDNISDWDKKFMEVEMEMLFLLIIAANYLDVKGLLDLGCKTIANMIKGHSPEEVKEKFKIPPTSEFYKGPSGAAVAAVASSSSSAAAAAAAAAPPSSAADVHMAH